MHKKLMRQTLVLAVIPFVLASISSMASGQDEPPTGSRLGSRLRPGTVLPPDQAARATMEIAVCLDFKRPQSVRNYLMSNDPATVWKSLNKEQLDCMGNFISAAPSNEMTDTRKFSIPEDFMRGLLAEVQLRRANSAIAALAPMKLESAYTRPWFGATTRNIVVDEMATCISETNPSGVALLLATEIASPAESSAFAALSPNFGPCLRVGARLQANRQSLRSALAEALFHRVYDPAPGLPIPPTAKAP